jgi:hypothetical protein
MLAGGTRNSRAAAATQFLTLASGAPPTRRDVLLQAAIRKPAAATQAR